MPTYEYRCKDCGHEFEAVQAFSDDALTECPTCHGALRKVFGNVGITFKGSGFYKNDSRAGAKNGNGAKADATSGDASGSKDAKADSGAKSSESSSPKESAGASSSSSSTSSATPTATPA